MTTIREKTLSYRRAEWFVPTTVTLEHRVREVHRMLRTVEARTIARGGQRIRNARSQTLQAGGVLLHLTAETPGEPASVVPTPTSASAEVSLKTEAPPPDGEWLDGDAFLYIHGDHVCICGTEIRDGAIRHFFHQLFSKGKLPVDATKFDLMKVADMSKVKLLQMQGVKELEIRATLYQAAANYAKRKSHVAGVAGLVGKHIKALLGKPNDVTPDALRVMLTIKTDKRQKGLALGEKEIERLATDVVRNNDADDDYVIVTNKGQRITPHEISMKSRVGIEADGKTVKCEKAWRELMKFFKELHDTGILEGG